MIKYKLKTPRGGTSKVFYSLIDAYRHLKKDSPDLEPRDIYKQSTLTFADGFVLEKHSFRHKNGG